MCSCLVNGFFYRKLLALWFWVWNFCCLGILTFTSTRASSNTNPTSSVPASRQHKNAGEGGESDWAVGQTTTAKPNGADFHDNEDFPLWIIVLIAVTAGLFLVACILCVIKLYRWKNDSGTYSMWNTQGPSVEAMFARESGVLFERLDIESSLAEAQCYEIPVDSFETPQRIYVDGVRVASLETPVSERSVSQVDAEVKIIDHTQYCPAKKTTSVSTDVSAQRESMPSSTGPDTSSRSSISMSTVSDKEPSTSAQDTVKEVYPKPLPVAPLEETPSVVYDIYTLDIDNDAESANAIVNRPLPQTPSTLPLPPHPSTPPQPPHASTLPRSSDSSTVLKPPHPPTPPQPPHPSTLPQSPNSSRLPVQYSVTSLDRVILKQRKEEKVEKPNTSRTLPRPRKLRQIPLPFFNAIARSASSTDVSKEAERLSDHVASDPNKCTLTRMKKRWSQSLDTLIASSERASHFYENPYLVEGTGMEEGKGGDPSGDRLEPPYSRVSSIPAAGDENLPKDSEHVYTRISQYMDGQNINRHSYASVHYPSFRSRPKSKHVYISIVFGSEESVCIPSIDNPKQKVKRTLSKSCPTLNSSCNSDIKNNPRPHSYYPAKDTPEGLYSIDSRNPKPHTPSGVTNELIVPGLQYQNIRESLGIPPLVESATQNSTQENPNSGYQNLKVSADASRDGAEIYKTPRGLDIRPYYENITCIRDNMSPQNEVDNDIDTSHYGVPKSPPIPLNRFCDILKTTDDKITSPQGTEVASEDHGNLEIRRRRRDTENARDKCAKNGERETLSTYLEGRFNSEEFDERRTNGVTGDNDVFTDVGQNNGPIYENFISNNRGSCTSEDLSTSQDRGSLTSSLSIEDKEIFEDQPLIPKTSDVNGNSMCEGFVAKLKERRKSSHDRVTFGESIA